MSRIPARFLGTAATVALVIAPLVAAGPTQAATAASPRHPIAMMVAGTLGNFAAEYSRANGLDGRSVRSVRSTAAYVTLMNQGLGGNYLTVTGLTDRNRDGLDDDAKVTVRAFDNIATLTLRKNLTFSVADAGFVFRNRRSVLKESAQGFDRILRVAASTGIDSWDLKLLRELKTEMPKGVRVVSDYDGNHDGYDDDGRLTFLAGGKAVTLTIGNTGKQVGKVTYGPTWRTKAPKRTHRPVAPRYVRASLTAR